MRLIFIILFLVCSQFFFDALHSQESVCNDGSLSQEQVVECEYIQKNNPDWTKNFDVEEYNKLMEQEEMKKKNEKIDKNKEEAITLEHLDLYMNMLTNTLSGNLDYPDINIKTPGLNMFDEEEADLKMKCWADETVNFINIEKVGDTIWRRKNDGARMIPAKIIESDDNAKKYYAPVLLVTGKVDVVVDFKNKLLQQSSTMGGETKNAM